MAQSALKTYKNQILAELKASRKKAALLAVLMALAGVLGTRLLVRGFAGKPKTAIAATVRVPASASPPPVAPAGASAADSGDSDDEARLNDYIEKSDRKITRNLFAMNADLFPLVDPVEHRPKHVETPTSRPAGPDATEVRRQVILAEAGRLELQAVMMGSSPAAMINGSVVRIGTRIQGFSVTEIGEKSCALEKSGVRVTLKTAD